VVHVIGSHLQGTVQGMARRARARRPMTLFEIIAVTAIIGILGAMAAFRFGSATVADVGAQGFARRLALDCFQARRRAIATGDNHLVRFTLSGPNATQYALYRRQGASTNLVDDVHVVPTSVTVTTGGVTDVEFQYTGEALASYTITVSAPDRTRTVTVYQVTGKAFVQ
jgi:type II secretory pathway pseudopilin PulG